MKKSGIKNVLFVFLLVILFVSMTGFGSGDVFVDTTDQDINGGSFFKTTVTGTGADANITLNVTDQEFLSFEVSGNFTSRIFDTGQNFSVFDKIAWSRVLTNSSDVLGYVFDTSVNDVGVFYRNGSIGTDTTQLDLASDVNFTGGLIAYTIPTGFDRNDIIGFAWDDDATANIFAFFRNGSVVNSTQNSLTSDVSFAETSTFSIPSGFNASDIIGFAVDSGNTDSAVFFKNGSYVRSDTESAPFNYNIVLAYSLPSDFDINDAIGIAYDRGVDDVAIFFRNGSFVSDTTQTIFTTNIVFDTVRTATYTSSFNLVAHTNITLQTRVSNDSITFTPFSRNYTNPDGSESIEDNVARFIQYKAVFETPDKYVTPFLENVSINFTILDIKLPRINLSINNSAPKINDVVNISANVSDNVALSFCQFIINQSNGAKEFFNLSVSGKDNQCSQNFTIALVRGNVINFTVLINDTSNNKNQSEQIITVSDSIATVTIGINNTTPKINDVVNVSSNVSDADGLSFCLIKNNQTGSFVTNTFDLSGTSGFCSDTIIIIAVKGNAINFTVEINDSVGGIIYQNSTLITVANTLPILNIIVPNVTWLEDTVNSSVNLSAHFTDSDGDTLTFNSTNPPNVTVSINQTTGIVTLTPNNNFNGTNFINFTASDGIGTKTSNQVTLTVLSVNDAPTLDSIGNLTAPFNQLFTFDVNAVDVDEGDTLTFSSNSTIFTIDSSTGLINFTPTISELGNQIINIKVNDSGGLSDNEVILFSVVDIINASELTSPVLNLNETERQSATNVTINQSTFGGIDFGNNILNFSSITLLEDAFNISLGLISVDTDTFPGLNKSASLSMKGLNFTKAPLIFTASGFESKIGGVNCSSFICTDITYDVSNGILRFNAAHFTTFFAQTNTTNGAPIITSTPITSATKNVQYTYDVNANDPDGDTLVFSLLENPSGMSINNNTGLITFTPSSTGIFNVTVLVNDSILTDNQTYNLTVGEGARLRITDLDVRIDGKADNNVKNNSKISKEAEPGSRVKFDVEIENLFTKAEDMEITNIEVEITIRDIDDDDDLDEEEDEFDLDPGENENAIIEFDIPLEVEEDTYDVIIDIEGIDENDTIHKIRFELRLEVEKEDHEIRIIRSSLSPSTISCDRTIIINTEIINTGQDDEDDVTLEILSPELGINSLTTEIELDEGTDDNRFSQLLTKTIRDGVELGTYPITINTYYDNKLSDTETVSLTVQECVQVREIKEELKEEKPDVQVIIPDSVKSKKSIPSIEISFADTNEYIVLLSILIIIFIGTAIFIIGAGLILLRK